MSAVFGESDVNALQTELESALRPELRKSEAAAVESIAVLAGVSFVATHILLPILVGLTDKLLYEKFKEMSTAAEAKAAKRAIVAPARQPGQSVPKERIRRDMVKKLIGHGISKIAAKRIVEDIIQASNGKLRGGE